MEQWSISTGNEVLWLYLQPDRKGEYGSRKLEICETDQRNTREEKWTHIFSDFNDWSLNKSIKATTLRDKKEIKH